MPSLKDQLGSLVYSTEHGDICPQCRAPKEACRCDEIADQARLEELDGIVRIRRETSGRKGKGVTTISGVPLAEKELKALAKELKKRCGTGGALKDGIIEIQGDHRQVLKEALEKKGFKVKLAGG
ncbi:MULTISPECIES: translation initiation factor Sui1 [unclassified Halomonas]|uniref:translation initiation factor Sui1 n=1 Tax=unclassified Halomonas TaxID=2609666 RepID=UPI001C966620|nr:MULTISPECIES: translation initiation factor Sui1 [unclassified Halomonas]MED5295815.1 translation initiation factor Sui1 [Pseudomonadota bacterium]MBY5926697.1 translation initiation factor Sui1 [Halomonas sp. DP4Y7-2]MBY5928526.1 translation initiation factor Sui1 [Halomonas sp. DP8Y7-3]MBY5983195.1 translation initiation factor Sui1 [Halomonas sp. DP5Y7-2]MBY6028653.1 translation initiation factor Sui1 [Halomonas sp. DP8Y7-1]